ncbi:MAG: ZIP family metal transporter, partial [Candidatus Woesearchaeota archaeon]|nr:ZIP family metal transporter [Candidatus Woesearchaeota archaeon]
EFGDFNVLLFSGMKSSQALFFNFLSALTAIAGALVAYIFSQYIENATPYLLAFGAGGFAYIALADLLPELHHESSIKKGVGQLVMFVLGIVIISGLIMLVHE